MGCNRAFSGYAGISVTQISVSGRTVLSAVAMAILALCLAAGAQTQLGSIAVGATANGIATVTVSQAGTLKSIQVLTQGASGLDFDPGSGGSCATGTAYSAGQTCTVNVTFTPKYPGARYGAVVLSDAGGNVLGTAYLQGNGMGAQIGYIPFGGSQGGNPCAVTDTYGVAGVALDGLGNLYLTCPHDSAAFKLTPIGGNQYISTQIAFNIGTKDGLFYPDSIAVDGAGNVYIDDSVQNRVVMERPTTKGYVQEDLNITGLKQPTNMVVDGGGNLYIDDFQNSRVVEETPEGTPYAYSTKILDENVPSPAGLAVDGSGNVFFTAPSGNDQVFMYSPASGMVQLLGSGFNGPGAVGADNVGNVYVLDAYDALFVERPMGAGTYEQEQLTPTDTNGHVAPGFPMTVDAAGNIWTPAGEYGQATPPPEFMGSEQLGAASPPRSIGIMNLGNEPLSLGQIVFPPDFPEVPGQPDDTFPPNQAPVGECLAGETLNGSEYCMLGMVFRPSGPLDDNLSGNLYEDITVGTNVMGSPEQIPVSGTAIAEPSPVTILTTSSSPSIAGQPLTLTATVTAGMALNGSVTFKMGASLEALSTGSFSPPLLLDSSGRATYTAYGLTAGTYYFQATYGGSVNVCFGPSDSQIVEQMVVPAPAVSDFGEKAIGAANVGASSAAVPLTIAFAQAETLGGVAVVTDGMPKLDFEDAGGGTCMAGQSYAQNATCTVNVAFKPQLAGLRRGAVVLTDTGGNAIGTGYVSGVGKGPQVAVTPGTFGALNGATVGALSLATDAGGNIYAASSDTNVYKLTPANGSFKQEKILSGANASAVAVDGAGDLFLISKPASGPQLILKETPGSNGFTATSIGSAIAPAAIAVDGLGDVYIADGATGEARVLMETPTNGGYVETQIGSAWDAPNAVAVDGAGNVYVLDEGPQQDLQQYSTGGLFMAVPGKGGFSVNPIATPRNLVHGMGVDAAGDVYLLENSLIESGSVLEKESPQPDGSYASNVLYFDANEYDVLALDAWGDAYTALELNGPGSIRELIVASPPSLTFDVTEAAKTSADSPQAVTVNNIGNAALDFSAVSFPADFPEAAGISGDCGATTALAAGAGCTLTIDFTPEASQSGSSGQLSEAVSFTANALNAVGTKTSIAVGGTETIPALSLTATAVTVAPGAASGNTSTVTVTPGGGLTGSVSMTAAVTANPPGAQNLPTVSVTSPVSITGSGSVTATVTVNTTAATSALNRNSGGRPGWPAGGGAVLAVLACFGARRRRWRWMLGLAGLAFVCLVTSCGGGGNAGGGGGGGGGGGNPGTTPGNYTITITATAGNTSAKCTVALTVQ